MDTGRKDKPEPGCHAYLTVTVISFSGGSFSHNCMFFFLQQPNFKQKFVALLKRFKVTDEVSVERINGLIDTQENMFNVRANDVGNFRRVRHPSQCTCLEFLSPSLMKLLVNQL